MATEPKTGLTFWPPGALQPDLLFNALLYWLAAWAQPLVLGIKNDPPDSPADGDAYLVGVGTGAWSGHDNEQARWDDESGIWRFFAPFEGYEIRNLDTGDLLIFDGSDWGAAPGGVNAYTIVTESSAFTADPGTHDGLTTLTLAGGDVTFSDSEPYTEGMTFNIRATSPIELLEDSVTLDPPAGGTLDLDAGMAVQVVMTGATTGIVIGQTVPA